LGDTHQYLCQFPKHSSETQSNHYDIIGFQGLGEGIDPSAQYYIKLLSRKTGKLKSSFPSD